MVLLHVPYNHFLWQLVPHIHTTVCMNFQFFSRLKDIPSEYFCLLLTCIGNHRLPQQFTTLCLHWGEEIVMTLCSRLHVASLLLFQPN